MKPLTRDFWWMIAWLVFAILQVINLFLKTVETNEQGFSRFMVFVWVVIATVRSISHFIRWRNAVNRRAANSTGNE